MPSLSSKVGAGRGSLGKGNPNSTAGAAGSSAYQARHDAQGFTYTLKQGLWFLTEKEWRFQDGKPLAQGHTVRK